MKKSITAFLLTACLCMIIPFITGCGTPATAPTASQAQWAERERTRLRRFMHEIEDYVQTRKYDDIMRRFVYAGTTADVRQANYVHFRRATWIPEMDGYRFINLEEALHQLHWEDLTWGQKVQFRVNSTCSRGRVWEDSFRLFRPETDWMITGAILRAPDPGAVIVLDDNSMDELASLVQTVLEQIQNGDRHAVAGMLPKTYEARYRKERPGLLGRMLMQKERERAIEDDLQLIEKLDLKPLPEAHEGFPARYAGGMSVFMSYELHCEGGNLTSGPGAVTLDVYVTENENKTWELRKIRFRGPPLPN